MVAYKKLTAKCFGLSVACAAGPAVWIGGSQAVGLFSLEGSSALPSAWSLAGPRVTSRQGGALLGLQKLLEVPNSSQDIRHASGAGGGVGC